MKSEVMELAVDKVIPTGDNPRRKPKVTDADIRELAASMKAHGQLQPVLVRPHPSKAGCFDLRAGERRWTACKAAGIPTITAIVADMTEEKAMEVTVLENLAREDLSPIEEGRAVATLLKKHGGNVKAVADACGKPAPWVYRRASMGRLSKTWQKLVDDPKKPHSTLSAGCLEVVARLPEPVQDRLLDEQRWLWNGPGLTVSDLNSRLGRHFRVLKKAPWSENGTPVVAGAPTCQSCGHRSTCNPELWTGELKEECCLDEKCFAAKETAWLKQREKTLREEHGDTLQRIATDIYGDRSEDVLHPYDYKAVKKATPGAKPALVVSGNGLGQVKWIQKQARSSRTERSAAEKQRDREMRMWVKVRKQFLETCLEPMNHKDVPGGATAIVLMAAQWGTAGRLWPIDTVAKTFVETLKNADGKDLGPVLWNSVKVHVRDTVKGFYMTNLHSYLPPLAAVFGFDAKKAFAAVKAEKAPGKKVANKRPRQKKGRVKK